MALVALAFALISVGVAAVVALQLRQGERRRAERFAASLDLLASMTDGERALMRSELVRELATARRGSKAADAALARVFAAAFGIGVVGVVGLLVQLRAAAPLETNEPGQVSSHPGAFAAVVLDLTRPGLLGLGLLVLSGGVVIGVCVRARRASLEGQRRLLEHAGLLDRRRESR